MKDDIVLQVGVKVLLQNEEGKFLLLRRSLEKYPEVVGRWDIVGGGINPGQTLLENLQREIREETDLELVDDPVLIAAQDILHNPSRHVVRLTYIGKAKGEVKLDMVEHDKYKWCDWEELVVLEDVDVFFKELLESGKI